MAQTPEGKVKDWIIRQLRKEWPNLWFYKPLGGPYGRKGTPDILLCIEGLFVAIEAKAKEGMRPTEKQSEQLGLIYDARGVRAVIDGKHVRKINVLIRFVRYRLEQMHDNNWKN